MTEKKKKGFVWGSIGGCFRWQEDHQLQHDCEWIVLENSYRRGHPWLQLPFMLMTTAACAVQWLPVLIGRVGSCRRRLASCWSWTFQRLDCPTLLSQMPTPSPGFASVPLGAGTMLHQWLLCTWFLWSLCIVHLGHLSQCPWCAI